VAQEFNVLALFKGDERYIYVYEDDGRDLLIDCFRNQAANPDMNLSWFDAAVLTDKAKQQVEANRSVCEDISRSRIDQTYGRGIS
jgi:hypothetical protein